MLSIVIPIFNEKENIRPLVDELIAQLNKFSQSYEIIFVDDGSTDDTYEELEKLYRETPNTLKIISFRRNFGKAAAYTEAFIRAGGDQIVTLDGDGQDDPAEIPKLLSKLNEGYDMVSGWKSNRKDSFVKNITSKIFNAVVRLFYPVRLHDMNCGLKAYTKEAASSLRIFGELHRYIPVLLAANGYNITEVPIAHRRRFFGKSKYGPVRFINGFLDLFTMLSITKFRTRPMHFFGYIGSLFFSIGFLVGLYLTYVKLIQGQAIGERPLLLLSVMLMIMGVQIAVSGLVGEYITIAKTESSVYDIKKLFGYDRDTNV